MKSLNYSSLIFSIFVGLVTGVEVIPGVARADELAGAPPAYQWEDKLALGENALGVLDSEPDGTRGERNTALGIDTMMFAGTQDDNTAVGYHAMKTNAGEGNTLIGAYAGGSGPFTTNNNNTGVGYRALASNQANNNTAIGYNALADGANIGKGNVALGFGSLQKNFHGSFNTASGSQALNRNTAGKHNTASGSTALYKNTTGKHNTASGSKALANNTTGRYNTAVGSQAGGKNNRGSANVFIGNQAGYNTDSNASNKLVIANGKLSANELITGDFSTHTVHINGDLHATGTISSSDGRLKKDIKPLTHALDAILQLEGKTYRWNEGATFANKKDIGLIAQEVEKVFPELVAENEQGYKGIAYSKLTAVLIEAIKEQQGQD